MARTEFSESDRKWMRAALKEAAKGAGHVSPNPLVGCVIVRADGTLLAKGHHARYGEPHAETEALRQVKDERDLIDATVYVTLEPCAHHGKTPPCAIALAETPIKRVVVALPDPNPKVDGKGIRLLRDASIRVDVGLMQEEAALQNEAFLKHMTTGRPLVVLKIAQTLDGYTAAPNGDSQWITGEEARREVHRMRARYDAVMVGRTTALIDNPALTVRMVEGRQPKRIVIDGDGSLPRHLNLFSDAGEERTIRIGWRAPSGHTPEDPLLALMAPGGFAGTTLTVAKRDGHTDLAEALDRLGAMGIGSILVESGGDLASALLRRRLVDKLHVFIAPKLLGGGRRSVLGIGVERLAEAHELKHHTVSDIGGDLLITGWF